MILQGEISQVIGRERSAIIRQNRSAVHGRSMSQGLVIATKSTMIGRHPVTHVLMSLSLACLTLVMVLLLVRLLLFEI